MENMALLFPYILMTINIATLVGILGYGTYCALRRGCVILPPKEVNAVS